MKKYLLFIPILMVLDLSAQEVGPANGSLVVAGGGVRDVAIFERFLDLAGGTDVPVVVIPTAGGRESYDQNWRGLLRFKRVGATDLTVSAHLRSCSGRHRRVCGSHQESWRRLVFGRPPLASSGFIP